MANYHSAPAGRPDGTAQGEGKIRCSHLLIKHRDSRRPSSWREAEITRSKEEAIEILRGHEQRIRSGEVSLGDIAVSESDCSSARKKGDLYVTSRVIAIPSLAISNTNSSQVGFSAVARCKRNSRMPPLRCSQARSAALLRRPLVSTLLNGKYLPALPEMEELRADKYPKTVSSDVCSNFDVSRVSKIKLFYSYSIYLHAQATYLTNWSTCYRAGGPLAP